VQGGDQRLPHLGIEPILSKIEVFQLPVILQLNCQSFSTFIGYLALN